MKKTSKNIHQQEYESMPCNHCNAKDNCSNPDCFLYAAYVRGENVPIGLITHMNLARNNGKK